MDGGPSPDRAANEYIAATVEDRRNDPARMREEEARHKSPRYRKVCAGVPSGGSESQLIVARVPHPSRVLCGRVGILTSFPCDRTSRVPHPSRVLCGFRRIPVTNRVERSLPLPIQLTSSIIITCLVPADSVSKPDPRPPFGRTKKTAT